MAKDDCPNRYCLNGWVFRNGERERCSTCGGTGKR